MHERLLGGEALVRVHQQQALHEVQALLGKLAGILLLNRFWLGHVWELEADESGVLRELLLLEGRQSTQYFLYFEKLVDL